MSNITTKTNRISVENRKCIINNAVCKNPDSVIAAIREMGISNPIETENAWKIFCDENGTFHTQLLKNFLYEKGFMSVDQLNNEKCTVKEIAVSVFNCMKSGIGVQIYVGTNRFALLKGEAHRIYSPLRLSTPASSQVQGTLSKFSRLVHNLLNVPLHHAIILHQGAGCTLMCIICKPFVNILTPLRKPAVIGIE